MIYCEFRACHLNECTFFLASQGVQKCHQEARWQKVIIIHIGKRGFVIKKQCLVQILPIKDPKSVQNDRK